MKHFLSSLALLSLPAIAAAQTAVSSPSPASASDQTVKLEAVTVTGSNLPLGTTPGAQNVRLISTAEIDQSGLTNVDAVMRKFPEVASGSFNGDQVNTSSPGAAGISLRGLGVQSTLVLMNGRRIAPAPYGQGGSAASLGTQSFVDMNMIPLDAVGRIEVLKDGASAIYGADAVGGVVNFILKDDIQGTTVRAYYGNFLNHGNPNAATDNFSVYSGAKEGKLHVFALGTYFHQNAVNYEVLPQKTVLASAGQNPATFILPVGATNPVTGVVVTSATAAAAKAVTVANGTSTYPPTFISLTSAQNPYNANFALDPQPEATRAGALFTARYDLTPTVELFAELNYQHNDSYEYLSPDAISALNTVVLPANAVYNPFGVAITTSPAAGSNLIYRFTEAGNRLTKTTNRFYRGVAGAKGTFWTDWNWEISGLYNTELSHNDLSSGWISQNLVNASLANPNPALAVNLFTNSTTHNSASVIESVKSHGVRDAYTELYSGTAKANGSIAKIHAGEVDLAVGVEADHEHFRDHRTQDQLLNQSTPVPLAIGSRTVEAGFAELGVPLTAPGMNLPGLYSVSLDLAGRAEHYSDRGFSNAAVPKIGLRYQPFDDEITFRASWGKGYRAPSLLELYQPQATSIGFNVVDPLRFPTTQNATVDGASAQRSTITGGNPNLSPEKSKNYNLGVSFEPHFLPSLSVSADYYHIEVRNRIGSPASSTVMLSNPGIYGQYIVRNPPTAADTAAGLPGTLVSIYQVLGNYGTAITDGIDLAAEYRIKTSVAGTFTVRLVGTNAFTLRTQGATGQAFAETAGTYEVPKFRGSASAIWDFRKFEAVYNLDYVGPFNDTTTTHEDAHQTIMGAQLSYELPWRTRLTVGVNNLDNVPPPLTGSSDGYAESTAYVLPRFIYVEVTKKF
jgi:iron complex outermembrane receptor protein